MVRIFTRRSRNVLVRLAIAAFGIGLIYSFIVRKQSPAENETSEHKRGILDVGQNVDVPLEHKEFVHEIQNENVNIIMNKELNEKNDQAPLPAKVPQLRPKQDKESLKEEDNIPPKLVFKEKPKISQYSTEYYTESELKPWLEKPTPIPSAPGEYGKAYKISKPTDQEAKDIKAGWDRHAFNEYVCDRISLHRFIGDKRDQECKVRKWRKPMPTTSVIIIFHNEAWCTLLRTVYSVLENSPKVLLKEVILVDDASTHDDLKDKLDNYISTLPVTSVIHNKERVGLIQARLIGAAAAKGEVLTFLDSHCECAPAWLEPMLERIGEDPTRVICPVIEVIDSDSFALQITRSSGVQVGILSWNLNFNWKPQSDHLKKPDDAVASPTMAGGLFAMHRAYFYFLGSYDGEMKVWGGENIEMSLRIWMCGGTLEIHPCSHVGHVFRKRAPYSHPGGGDVIVRNSRRVADVWLDEYKTQFYKRVPRALKIDVGDISERVQLRKDLGCKSFEWYINNIYPDLYAPRSEDVLKSGEWKNEGRENKYCLDSGNPDGKSGVKTSMYVCHQLGGNQDYMMTRQGELRHNFVNELCLQPDGTSVVTEVCHFPKSEVPAIQRWEYTEGRHIRHIESDRCMEAVEAFVLLQPCTDRPTQIWNVHSLIDL